MLASPSSQQGPAAAQITTPPPANTPQGLIALAADTLLSTCQHLGLCLHGAARLPRGLGLHEALHPVAVSTLACRATQLAGGDVAPALALLGAWVLEGLASKSAAPSQASTPSSPSSHSYSSGSSRSRSSDSRRQACLSL